MISKTEIPKISLIIIILISFVCSSNSNQIEKHSIKNRDYQQDIDNNDDNDNEKQMYILTHSIQGPHGWIDTVRISQDGHRVSLISDKSVFVYRYNQSISSFGPNPYQIIALQRNLWTQDLCRDHQRMILGGTGNTLGSYQLTSDGYKFLGFFKQPSDQIVSIKITPDGNLFVAAGFIKQPLIYYRNVSQPIGYSLIQKLPSIQQSTHATSITYNGQFLSIADANRFKIYEKVYDQNSTQGKFNYRFLQQDGWGGAFQITSMDSSIISYINQKGKQQLFSQQQIKNLSDYNIQKSLLVTASTDQFVQIFHYNSILKNFTLFQQIHIQNEKILTLSLVMGGQNLAIGTSGKKIIIYQLQSNKKQDIYTSKWKQTQTIKIGCWIRSIRFSVTNGKSLIVGGDDGKFRILEVGKCKQQDGEQLINGQCITKQSSGLSIFVICLIVGSGTFLITFLICCTIGYKNRKRLQKIFHKKNEISQPLMNYDQQEIQEKSLKTIKRSVQNNKKNNSKNSSISQQTGSKKSFEGNKKEKVQLQQQQIQDKYDQNMLRSSFSDESSNIKFDYKQPNLTVNPSNKKNKSDIKIKKEQQVHRQYHKPRILRKQQMKIEERLIKPYKLNQRQKKKQKQKNPISSQKIYLTKRGISKIDQTNTENNYKQPAKYYKSNMNQVKWQNQNQEKDDRKSSQQQITRRQQQQQQQQQQCLQVTDACIQKNKKKYGVKQSLRQSYQQQQ